MSSQKMFETWANWVISSQVWSSWVESCRVRSSPMFFSTQTKSNSSSKLWQMNDLDCEAADFTKGGFIVEERDQYHIWRWLKMWDVVWKLNLLKIQFIINHVISKSKSLFIWSLNVYTVAVVRFDLCLV